MRSLIFSDKEPDWASLPIDSVHEYSITPPASIQELVEAADDSGILHPIPQVVAGSIH